jgi:uncharacterized protein YggU (UPF0235/DUF167 family)
VSRHGIRVTPRSAADRIDIEADGTLHVHVRAAPVDGAANEAVIRLLARHFDVPRSRVALVAGGTARRKIVEIDQG